MQQPTIVHIATAGRWVHQHGIQNWRVWSRDISCKGSISQACTGRIYNHWTGTVEWRYRFSTDIIWKTAFSTANAFSVPAPVDAVMLIQGPLISQAHLCRASALLC